METQFCKESIMKKSLTFYTLFAVTKITYSRHVPQCTIPVIFCTILYLISFVYEIK